MRLENLLVAGMCVLWAACSFGQSSPTSIPTSSAAKVVCKSESEEVVLHANASAALPIVDILPCAAEVTVVSKQTGWYRVRTQDGKEGYVKDMFLAGVGQATGHPKDGYIVCTLGVSGLWLLESPKGFGTNTKMHCGEKITVLEELPDKDSYRIETSGGNVGYAWRGSVSWNPQTAEVQALEAQNARAALEAQNARAALEAQARDAATPDYYHRLSAIGYAIRATKEMRDAVWDPASFTLMQVVAYYTKADKKGRIEIGGCVHFVASNAFGGRVQQWGWYEITRYSDQFHSGVVSYDSCVHPRDAVVTDVTTEVKQAVF
jgi:hypothetical protein